MHIEDWGLISYKEAYLRQQERVKSVQEQGQDGYLVFCEHPAVLTLGRMTKPDSLIYSMEDIQARSVEVYPVDRGGDVTLHAPGQMVVYVIWDLNKHGRDIKKFLEQLEEVAVDLLKDFGILAISVPGKRGVFVGPKKIISIGVGARKWVTYHGLGINVSTDLSLFALIKPCGLDVQMTSILKETGSIPSNAVLHAAFVKHFKDRFGV